MARATADLIAAASRGELSPSEAESFLRLIEVHAKMIVVHDFEERLTKLEEQGQ